MLLPPSLLTKLHFHYSEYFSEFSTFRLYHEWIAQLFLLTQFKDLFAFALYKPTATAGIHYWRQDESATVESEAGTPATNTSPYLDVLKGKHFKKVFCTLTHIYQICTLNHASFWAIDHVGTFILWLKESTLLTNCSHQQFSERMLPLLIKLHSYSLSRSYGRSTNLPYDLPAFWW